MSATDPFIPMLLLVIAGAYLLWAIFKKVTRQRLGAGEEAILALAMGWCVAAAPIILLVTFSSAIPSEFQGVLFGFAVVWGIAWLFGAIIMARAAWDSRRARTTRRSALKGRRVSCINSRHRYASLDWQRVLLTP